MSAPRADEKVVLEPVALVALGSVVACSLLGLWLDTEQLLSASAAAHLIDSLRVISAALFFGAGVLRISRWRLTQEPRSALMGISLVVFGSLTFPLSDMAQLMHLSEAAVSLSPFTRTLTTLVALSFVAVALRGWNTSTRLRPGLLTAAAVLCTLTGFLGFVVLNQWYGVPLDPSPATHTAIQLVVAAAWFAVACAASKRAKGMPWAGRAAAVLAGMGTVELLRTMAIHDLYPWATAAATLATMVAALALYGALRDLFHAASVESDELEAAQSSLVSAKSVVSSHHAWREELAHDARNSIAGLRAALVTMARYDGRVDAATSQRLRFAVLDEIGHLEHLIVRSDRDDLVDFRPVEVLRSVVEARRATGLDVRLFSSECWAHGRPGDLATTVQNLLVNAQRHAPGGPVTVSVREDRAHVEIRVADSGVGVPADLRSSIFERGTRGGQSTGSGLGLHVARELMRGQQGDLVLAPSDGGAVFVVTMPRGAQPVPQAQLLDVQTTVPRQRRRYADLAYSSEAR